MTLKPTDLGVTGNFSNLSSYKTKVIASIANKREELDSIYPRYAEYLEWLVDNATGGGTFKISLPPKAFDEIKVYFAEVLGPIYVIEQLKEFPINSPIEQPTSAIQGAYDFKVDGAAISVKKSGNGGRSSGRTNTLKPGDIVGNSSFKTFISTSTPSMKNLFKIFETLHEENSLDGPWRLIYGTTGNNGLLKSLKPSVPATTQVLENQNILLDPSYNKGGISATAKEMFANDLEVSINGWSKSNSQPQRLKEFTERYLQYSGLTLFSLAVSTSSGKATATYSSNIKSAELRGKGRASPRIPTTGRHAGTLQMRKGEKMGIEMHF